MDYRSYLRCKIDENKHVKGYQALLAKNARCHRSVVSQVLSGKAELTLDQAGLMASFWELSELESDYFIELVLHSRAATPNLKKISKRRIEHIKNQMNDLSNVGTVEKIEGNEMPIYYSSHYWSLIHVALGIPEYQSKKKLQKALRISPKKLDSILESLVKMGIVKKVGSQYLPLKTHIHLKRNSMLTSQNHLNWRLQAVSQIGQNLQENLNNLHYTSVFSISEKDFGLIKDNILKLISAKREIIGPSKEEKVYCFTTDFFQVL